MSTELKKPPPLECPRCASANIRLRTRHGGGSRKPGYFCRACRRHWVHGGTRLMRRAAPPLRRSGSADADRGDPLECPRCASPRIKLRSRGKMGCHIKPIYFCDACQRYWAHGGARLLPRRGGAGSSEVAGSTKGGTKGEEEEESREWGGGGGGGTGHEDGTRVQRSGGMKGEGGGRGGEWREMERFLEWVDAVLYPSMRLDQEEGRSCGGYGEGIVVSVPEEFRYMF